jgi:hypothetical protein
MVCQPGQRKRVDCNPEQAESELNAVEQFAAAPARPVIAVEASALPPPSPPPPLLHYHYYRNGHTLRLKPLQAAASLADTRMSDDYIRPLLNHYCALYCPLLLKHHAVSRHRLTEQRKKGTVS